MTPPDSRTLFGLLIEQAQIIRTAPPSFAASGSRTYRDLADGAGRIAPRCGRTALVVATGSASSSRNRLEWLRRALANRARRLRCRSAPGPKPPELAYLLADSGVAALIAVMRSGGEDFGQPSRRWRRMPRNSASSSCSRRHQAADRLRRVPRRRRAARHASPGRGGEPADDALVLYTSGSSARPKAGAAPALCDHRERLCDRERMRLSPDDRVLLAPPLFLPMAPAMRCRRPCRMRGTGAAKPF